MRYQESIKYFWVLLLTTAFLPLFAFAAEELPHADQYGTLAVQTDHIDHHATAQAIFPLPGIFSRKDFSIQAMIRKGK